MDGHFVPNITIGPEVVKALRPHVTIPIDVHLMIAPADPYLEAFRDAGADHILVHPEAGPHLDRTLRRIRELGAKAGVVFNPSTPPEAIEWMMDDIDLILVMIVNPGFGGQSFMPSQLAKIARLRAMIDATGRDIVLEVDGGVDPTTARPCVEAGATALVAGKRGVQGRTGRLRRQHRRAEGLVGDIPSVTGGRFFAAGAVAAFSIGPASAGTGLVEPPFVDDFLRGAVAAVRAHACRSSRV